MCAGYAVRGDQDSGRAGYAMRGGQRRDRSP
jgi:hypothetical protein